MTRALLLVDMSNDFIQLDGALNCGAPGLQIVPYCVHLVDSFVMHREFVIDARDNHDVTDFEIASDLFPAHNLKDTWGQALVAELSERLNGHSHLWKYIPKKNYNAGFNTDLFPFLESKNIDEIHVVGVCTDICVRYTVNGLYEWKTARRNNLKIIVHEQGVASFNLVGHQDSLQHFETALGVEVI